MVVGPICVLVVFVVLTFCVSGPFFVGTSAVNSVYFSIYKFLSSKTCRLNFLLKTIKRTRNVRVCVFVGAGVGGEGREGPGDLGRRGGGGGGEVKESLS